MKLLTYVLFEVLSSLVSIQTSLNANNCCHRQNEENCLTWPYLCFWCTLRFSRLWKMLLVLHKMTFHENEATNLCVIMRKRSDATVGTLWHVKFWHRYQDVGNKFLWCQLQISLSQKRGLPPVTFLDEPSSTLYCLSYDINLIWHYLPPEELLFIYGRYIMTKWHNVLCLNRETA